MKKLPMKNLRGNTDAGTTLPLFPTSYGFMHGDGAEGGDQKVRLFFFGGVPPPPLLRFFFFLLKKKPESFGLGFGFFLFSQGCGAGVGPPCWGQTVF